MKRAGLGFSGRVATRLASWLAPAYKDAISLSLINESGYIAPDAVINGSLEQIDFGENIFIGNRCVFQQNRGAEGEGGLIKLGKKVQIYGDIIVETGMGGKVEIGDETHIQPRCQVSAFIGSVEIGKRCEIAPNCSFYSYNHRIEAGSPVREQPLYSKGGIKISDDVWLGVGVIVLDGVHIGKGAVIGAGSVVTKSIPEGALAFGNPAKVSRYRNKGESE